MNEGEEYYKSLKKKGRLDSVVDVYIAVGYGMIEDMKKIKSDSKKSMSREHCKMKVK